MPITSEGIKESPPSWHSFGKAGSVAGCKFAVGGVAYDNIGTPVFKFGVNGKPGPLTKSTELAASLPPFTLV